MSVPHVTEKPDSAARGWLRRLVRCVVFSFQTLLIIIVLTTIPAWFPIYATCHLLPDFFSGEIIGAHKIWWRNAKKAWHGKAPNIKAEPSAPETDSK